jgi:hypothetical protein
MSFFPQLFKRGGTTTAPRPPAAQPVAPSDSPNQAPNRAPSGAPNPRPAGPAGGNSQVELDLPEGWEIAEYAGDDGRARFAVYANGRRMASGMTSLRSAARWARLLAAGQP